MLSSPPSSITGMTSFGINSRSAQVMHPSPKVAYSINCSLCGCNGAAVRCEKCNSMAFCIGCDDMYHRHPKRRNHLRQAVALEFLQAFEKHQVQQQQLAEARTVKSPDGSIKPDNNNLYPWRRVRTLPRMPEHYNNFTSPQVVQTPIPVIHNHIHNHDQHQQQQQMNHQQPVTTTSWASHPSKMPVPPPRRKKKTLSFSGLKDTFKKFVNPHHHSSHPKHKEEPEPIYATILKPVVSNSNATSLIQQQQRQNQINAAFRPLPSLPPQQNHNQFDRDDIYENTRKHSMSALDDSHNVRKKMFASTVDLREYENFTRVNGYPNIDPPGPTSKSLPRKNLSCADISQTTTSTLLNNHHHQHAQQLQQQQIPGLFLNGCPSCAHAQSHHGSTQSLFPGFFPGGGQHNPHAQLFSPNPFGCNHCSNCNSFQPQQPTHHWNCSQSIASTCSNCAGAVHRCPSRNGHHSLGNSLEELRNRPNRNYEDDDEDEDLSDEDEDEDEQDNRKKTTNNKNRRKTSAPSNGPNMRRTQSSYSMYPNLESPPGGAIPAAVHNNRYNQNASPNLGSNRFQVPTAVLGASPNLRSHNSSPSPSVKGPFPAGSSNRSYGKSNSDGMCSDSSSSQETGLLNSPKGRDFPTNNNLVNGNSTRSRKLSTSSSASSSRVRGPEFYQKQKQTVPLEQIQTRLSAQVPKVSNNRFDDADESDDEMINEIGQWSCRFCTFFNDSDKNVCEICCKTRLTQNQPQPPKIQQPQPSKPPAPKPTPIPTPNNKPTSVPLISSQTQKSQIPNNISVLGQSNNTTEQEAENEFIIDEQLIREQIEIERELARWRENERKIDEENRKLLELSTKHESEPKNNAQTSKIIVIQQPQQQKTKTEEPKETKPETTLDHEQIVARMIEEKISEKLSALKLNNKSMSGSNTSLNSISAKTKTEQIETKIENLPKEEISTEKQPQISSKPQQDFSPPNLSQTSLQTAQSSAQQPYQPAHSYQPAQPFNQYTNNSQFPTYNQGIQSNPNQSFAYQQPNQNGYAQNANNFAQPNQPTQFNNNNPYDSNQYLHNFAMHPQPAQPIIGGIGGGGNSVPIGGFNHQSQQSRPYQRHPSWTSDSSNTITNTNGNSKPQMNRISSFDDLQSMSSVTSAGSYYGVPGKNPNDNKNQMESGLHIIQTLRDAEKRGYTADDVEVAIQFNPTGPLDWLDDNWQNMCETVLTMANNQIIEFERELSGKKSNNFKISSLVSSKDARVALRICKGNIWQAVEKCIQRYQDNKAGFSTPLGVGELKTVAPSGGAKPKQFLLASQPQLSSTKSTKSFSLKVSGFGAGKANNDAYEVELADDNEQPFDARSDVAEEEVENLMNPDHLSLYQQQQEMIMSALTPMEAFLASKESGETNEVLDFYIRKLGQTDEQQAGNNFGFDRDQMEALIYNWRYEKMMMEAEREEMKRADKERQKMQKMLDLQRRIGGYMSDGTTTEEELDREVEQVFSRNHDEMMAKLAAIEDGIGVDDGASSDTTHLADIYGTASGGINSSSTINDSSTKTIDDKVDDDDEEIADQFDEIEQRIHAKLNSLLPKSTSEQISKLPQIAIQVPSNGTVASATNVAKVIDSTNDVQNQSIINQIETNFDTKTVTTEVANQQNVTISQKATNVSVPLQQSSVETSTTQNQNQNSATIVNVVENAATSQIAKSQQITANVAENKYTNVATHSTSNSLATTIATIEPVKHQEQTFTVATLVEDQSSSSFAANSVPNEKIVSNIETNVANATNVAVISNPAQISVELAKSSEKSIIESVAQQLLTSTSTDVANAAIQNDTVASVGLTNEKQVQPETSKQDIQENTQEITQKNVTQNAPQNAPQNIPQNAQPNTPQDVPQNASQNVSQNSLENAPENAPQIVPQKAQQGNAQSSDGKKTRKVKVKKVRPKKTDETAQPSKTLPNQAESNDSSSSQEQTTIIESLNSETMEKIEELPEMKEGVELLLRHQAATIATTTTTANNTNPNIQITESFNAQFVAAEAFDYANANAASLPPVPQPPVFSKLKGGERRQAMLRKSEPNLLRIKLHSTSCENVTAEMNEIKAKLQNFDFDNQSWDDLRLIDTPSPKHRHNRGNLFKSKSIDFDPMEFSREGSDPSVRRQRARQVIVHKLKSMDSVHSLSAHNLLEPFKQSNRQLRSHSNSSAISPARSSQSGTTEFYYSDGYENFTNSTTRPNKPQEPRAPLADFESLAEEAVENPPQDVRWSRLDYGVDFEWARTEFECELCTAMVPVQDIVAMIACTHFACRECLQKYFTLQIRERHRLVITCPFCDEPAIGADEDDKVFEYLGMFDPFIRHIVEPDVYELFQRKLRDRALMRDPSFLWCSQCSSGFIAPNPVALTVMCPDCRVLACRKCKKPWKKQHFNISCEAYAEWEMSNDPQYAEQQLNKHLKEFGIECPNCKFRYQLAKGGCMHFRCYQCSYDFCGGCSRPFKLGNRCFRSRMCCSLGLHAHHPRNCLFYLRDKDIEELTNLLDQHNVDYRTELEGGQTVTRCQVMELKETDDGMKDEACNRFVESAGLCKLHYKEYLGTLIFQNAIDPISIFTEVELEMVLRRENVRIPNMKLRNFAASSIPATTTTSNANSNSSASTSSSSENSTDEEYRKRLVELINDRIPLDLWE